MKNSLIIIGLDGGTFRIIDPLIGEGKLPNLARLIKEGTKAVLKSTIPPWTPPAWISFMTGMNPGKHGFFDFRKAEKITYDSPYFLRTKDTHSLLHSGYYTGNTLWDILSGYDYKISVIMMPMTYPAWKINGFMVSGFPSPDFKHPSTYPADWGSEIGPLFDLSALTLNDKDKLIRECKSLIRKQADIVLAQLKNKEIDVHAVVFSSTDFAQHQLWKYLDDPSSPYSSAITEIYIEIDKVIGKMLGLVAKECSVVVLSDHGFVSAPKKYFHPNAWLNKEGYLAIKEKTMGHKVFDFLLNPIRYRKAALKESLKGYFRYLPKTLQEKIANSYYDTNLFEWDKTRAFRYRIGQDQGVVVNLKGRQPEGIVEENEYEPLREEIIGKLKTIEDPETGVKVVKEVYKREELYSGKFLEMVPDIVFVLNTDYRGGPDTNEIIINPIHQDYFEKLNGVHERDGILILKGPKIKKGFNMEPVELVDLLPTILFNQELSIPQYVDGRVITEAFEEPFSSLPINYVDTNFIEKDVKSDLSQADEEVMKNALKGLGYLE